MSGDEIIGHLYEILPRLMRFVSVLSGDADLHGFNHDEFVAYLSEVAGSKKLAHSDDISAQFFSDVYAYWLALVEKGKLKPVVLQQEEKSYLPGVFSDEQDAMILQTGAFLVGLSPLQRAALLLVTGESFSYEQAAWIMRIPRRQFQEEIAKAQGILAGKRYNANPGLLKNTGLNQGVIPEELPVYMAEQMTGT